MKFWNPLFSQGRDEMAEVKRIFSTDLEGPFSLDDNAAAITADVGERVGFDGLAFFACLSAYDDFLALTLKAGYKAGDTLRLILPFLRACGLTNEWLTDFSEQHIALVPGAKETMGYIQVRMPSFIISTSFSPYVEALCRTIGFPADRTYSTALNLNGYAIPDGERTMIQDWLSEICQMSVIEIPEGVKVISNLQPEYQEVVRRLDRIFWTEMPGLACNRMLTEVKPVGGLEKAMAIDDCLNRVGCEVRDVMYVGDSITDEWAFRMIREGGGVAVSFNGNRYALREAKIVVIAGNAIILAVLADVFREAGNDGVFNLAGLWSPSFIRHANLVGFGVSEELADRFFEVYPLSNASENDPNRFPWVDVVTDTSHDTLTTVSERFRKELRGKVGELG